jgi:hypothetical protein
MAEIEWIEDFESDRIEAMAYDEENEMILVRFPDGIEWCYEACPPNVWSEFSSPGQSKGQFIFQVLNHKPHHRRE